MIKLEEAEIAVVTELRVDMEEPEDSAGSRLAMTRNHDSYLRTTVAVAKRTLPDQTMIARMRASNTTVVQTDTATRMTTNHHAVEIEPVVAEVDAEAMAEEVAYHTMTSLEEDDLASVNPQI